MGRDIEVGEIDVGLAELLHGISERGLGGAKLAKYIASRLYFVLCVLYIYIYIYRERERERARERERERENMN